MEVSAVVVVYVHGAVSASAKEVWYRVELPMMTTNGNNNKLQQSSSSSNNHPRKKRRKHHHHVYHPVGKTYTTSHGCRGSWAVIGDDIYRVCGIYPSSLQATGELGEELFKHNIYCSDNTYWKVESSSMNIRRFFPFVVSIEEEKLCVVSGEWYGSDYTYDSDAWKQCGEIYNLKKKRWDLIDVDYKDISSYCTFTQMAQDVDKPMEIVFYSWDGSLRVLHIAHSKLGPIVYPAKFDLWSRPLPPEALIINRATFVSEYYKPHCISNDVGAVLADGTFYWCTYVHLLLYAYDTKEEKWFSSPSLNHHFPQIYSDPGNTQYPILLGLGNGKFVLVLAIEYGHSVMAVITVEKKERNYLAVSVDPYHHVYYDESNFLPMDGKAMLKSTGSGSMH